MDLLDWKSHAYEMAATLETMKSPPPGVCNTLRSMADEIDRLRDKLRHAEAEIDRLRARVAEMERALRLVSPNCEFLHHPSSMRHEYAAACPVEDFLRDVTMRAGREGE